MRGGEKMRNKRFLFVLLLCLAMAFSSVAVASEIMPFWNSNARCAPLLVISDNNANCKLDVYSENCKKEKIIMKKDVCIPTLFLALCMVMVVPTFAAEEDNIDLQQIADEIITVSQTVQESGANVICFENLDVFAETVRDTYPEISDIELTKFVMEYMGQDCEDLTEKEILDILEYDNISTSSIYLRINDEEGKITEISADEALIMQADVWPSEDRLLQIETDFSKTSTDGSKKYFTVWTRCTCLICKPNGKEDVLVLGASAVFNDEYNEEGIVNRTYTCNNCSKTISKYNNVNVNSRVSGDVSIKYANYFPYLRFLSLSPYCDSCIDDDYATTRCNSFKSYIKFGIIVNGEANLQASYAHQTRGTGSISVGVDVKGIPSISIAPKDGEIKTYNARALTLK